MKAPANCPGASLITSNHGEGGEKNMINPELWQSCAGPLVNLPAAGTHVVYFPQGHSEQVAASMKKGVDAQIPSYPNLQSKLLCVLHGVTLHADPETDEVYAKMTLQPVPVFDKEALLRSDLLMKAHKPQTEFFCKTLTASDTSTHGGFSVPRRAAEKIFPPLDFSLQPPAQELMARDLHDNVWTFRHIFRGQPKRHLLTTGWSLFVSGKRLSAGDSVLFIRDEKQQLLLGIRRAVRQPANLSSSVLSSDSMHIGVLAAAAHASANNSPFTVFYNPRTSPSEFVIPLAKYYKAVCSNQLSLGMRFRMMFETEESGTRRYMGTITGISDLDGVRWKNSQWRNIQVGWDESAAGDRRNRVSIWEIEPVTAPFFICPTPFYGSNYPRHIGVQDDESPELDNLFKRRIPLLGDDTLISDHALSLMSWMNLQQSSIQPTYLNPLPQFNSQRSMTHIDQLQRLPVPATVNPLVSMMQPQQQLPGLGLQTVGQSLTNQSLPQNRIQSQIQSQNVLNHPLHCNVPQQMVEVSESQQKSLLPSDQQQIGQQLQVSENQAQLLQKHHQRQQSLLAHQSVPPQDQSFSMSISTNQRMQMPSEMPLVSRNYSQTNIWFSNLSHQHKQELSRQMTGHAQPPMDQISTYGPRGQSGVTDEVPSRSTSPSTNNGSIMLPSMVDGLATMSPNVDFVKDLQQKTDVKPLVNVSESQNKGLLAPQTYLHHTVGSQVDYLDSSSSGTSVCLSQNDVHLQHQNSNQPSFGSQPLPFSDTIQGQDVQDDPRTHISFGANNEDNLVTQSFGVPDMTFNSIDSTVTGNNLLNSGVWAPPSQPFHRLRTYTKVYKRGAVGRSIDITAYSGYKELKHDLARRFGIEGQLEDQQRIGWKLVYVDHESDVLLVGDDPWEEFVSCVHCIKILSPQEVQQMSLDGGFGRNSVLPNQACSSSDV